MDYIELEKLQKKWNGSCCIFGAGLIGSTWGYEIIKAAGFPVLYYCDNGKKAGTLVRDGLEVKDLSELCNQKENVYVFVCLSEKYQSEVLRQLSENGIKNVCIMDDMFLQEFCESIELSGNQDLFRKYACVMDDEIYLEQLFEARMGYKPDLSSPKTFNEKIQWLKIHDRKPEYTTMVDKYEAKKYVAEVIGEKYIIPTLGVWNSYDEIDFDTLPNEFVLKCTHDSGGIIICRDKTKFNHDESRKKLSQWLSRNYYWTSREWPYKNVKPRIIAERYIHESNDADLMDYKFYIFSGKCIYIQVDYDRFTNHHRNFYTPKWQYLNFTTCYPTNADKIIERPLKLNKMIDLAKKISNLVKNPLYVRVDMYLSDKSIYFGECTFYHGSGMETFYPKEYDEIMGQNISKNDL